MKPIESGSKLNFIRGAAWSLGTRWGMRILGFVNTLIMARLVMPEDYGLVAMSFLVVALIQSLLDFSAATAILRKDVVSRDEVDSAWTLRGLQGLAMGSVLIATVPFAEAYFQNPNVVSILNVFALCVSISGFGNIGLVLAQKNFEFSLEFRYQLYAKLISVVLTIISGWWFRDYRALVVGIASGYLGGVLLSYFLHPYRPRWNTSEIRSIWRITRWLMLANVGGFVLRKGDEIVAARIGPANDYGLYNVGADLGQMPTGEVGPAILKAFLPVLASMKSSEREVNAAVVKTLRVIATLTLPLGVGVASIAAPLTLLLLGDNWVDASIYVAIFAVVGAVSSLGGPVSSLMILRGHTRALSHIVWIEFAAFAISALVLVPSYSLFGLALARLVGAFVNLVLTYLLGSIHCKLSLVEVMKSLVRPIVGVLLIFITLREFFDFATQGIFGLIAAVLLGVVVYSLWITVSWHVAKCPEGFESTCLEIVNKLRLK